MKCPKCGYNSFENNDACPKCSADLAGFKGTFGLAPLVFPQAVRTMMAESMAADQVSDEHEDDLNETAHDMFAFDLPDETPAQSAAGKDPFDFDDTPASSDLGTGAFSFDDEPEPTAPDPFASLLESTSQSDGDAFASLGTPLSPPAASAVADTSSPGEFDLNSFSWDDTPSPKAGDNAKPAEDDFDSLFGDMDDTAKK